MKIVKYPLLISIVYLLSGCISKEEREIWSFYNKPSESLNIAKIEEECNLKGENWEVQMFSDGSGLCVNKKAKEEELKRKQQELEHYANYEKNYFIEYNNILKNLPTIKTTYIQPSNKKEPCKLLFRYSENNQWFKEESYKVFWDGECKNGFANGLGREIEKDNLIDTWGLAIYKDGKPTYYITNNILENVLFEGIKDTNKEISFGVSMQITEKMGDIDVIYTAFSSNEKELIYLSSSKSPFWNGKFLFSKKYPNFEYNYLNFENDDESKIDYQFFLASNKVQNGWTLIKPRNKSLVTGEYVMNKFNKVDLPIEYKNKSDEIIKEIKEAQQKAVEAQAQAQVVKKQYLNKICKDSIKVSFMDNDDYKSICNNKKEKELYSKINDKLQKMSKEKITRLEQQRYNEQQRQQEQYRNQQLEIERQKLAAQQSQAQAAQMNAYFNQQRMNQQGFQNLNNSLNNSWNETQMQMQNMQMQNLNNNLKNLNNNLNQMNGNPWVPQW